MMNQFRSVKLAMTLALLGAPLALAAQTTPLRSYATSGTEHARTYDAASGWTETVQTFTGTLELVTTTEARLTKHYADGTSVVRELILHWVVDLNAPVQGGTAAEVPDASDPVIKRTIYELGLQFDGLRYTMLGSYTTRAYLAITGYYQWYNVAYGDFTGAVVSPVGYYNISGTEKVGKTTSSYSGVFELLSESNARLTKVFTDGTTTTVDLYMETPVDLGAASQTVTAAQAQNQVNQTTSYLLDLNLNGTAYDVDCTYATKQQKGKTIRTVGTGAFAGTQQ